MSSPFPTEPKNIRERIARYERAFRDRHHDDGAGKRFLLGPLYMLMGDTGGAIKSYQWYKETFPDDVPEAFNHLCWVLALLRSGDEMSAHAKFREMVFENLYVVPIFLGENPQPHAFRHYSNWSEPDYIQEGPTAEIFSLWTESEKSWLKSKWEEPGLQSDVQGYIDCHKRLDGTNGEKERDLLIKQAHRIALGSGLKVV